MFSGPVRQYTKIITIVATVLLVAWDIYAYFTENNSTISVIMTDGSYYTPMLPFVAGVLMGHWFFPARGSGE